MSERRAQAADVVEQRYRLLVESVTDYAIYMLDTEGYVVTWNAGAEVLKGYREEEIIGTHFSRFYLEDEASAGKPLDNLEIAVHYGRFEGEGWRRRKDGRRFWAHVVIDPIRARSGELLGYAKITRDLTERRAAEEALRRSEEQFRLLVQGVTDYAIYMLDPIGNVVSWNAGAERIKGFAPDEVIGTHFSRFYRPQDREEGVPVNALAVAAREGRFESDGWRVRKDGTEFRANVVIDPIRDATGQLIGFAKVVRDVTERYALADRDELTDLPNRRRMNDLMELEIQRSARGGHAFCLVLFDIDHFKRVNDTRGHLAGDEVLRAFARVAAGALRQSDVLARWGGEEFALLLPDTLRDTAAEVADRLRTQIEAAVLGTGEHPLRVTVSAGVVERAQHEPLLSALERADRALYRAKEGGRNRVAVG